MQIGVVFPQTEFGSDPAAVMDYAQTVEGLGFSHVLAYDHVLGANPDRPGGWHGPYTHESAFLEPFVLFSFMAAATRQIGFITGILILPQRETALVAKQAATLDCLCGGRLRLGVGVGWNQVEYTALGQDFSTRERRQEEQVDLLRRLWTQQLVTYEGDFHTIPDAGIKPLPVQRPIPIWFGGHADVLLRRVARIGDGWLPNYRTPQDASAAIEALDRYLAAYGRSRDDIGMEPRLHYGDGDAEPWVTTCQAWQDAGATHLSVNTMGSGLSGPQEHIAALRRMADVLLH